MSGGPVVHVVTQGNLANRMIQFMVARRIASEVPGCLVSNVVLPDWGIDLPALPHDGSAEVQFEGQRVDTGHIAQALAAGVIGRAHLAAYGQWMGCFPPLDACRALFPEDRARYPGWGPEHLVVNLRGGEILSGEHANYTLLPGAFYSELVQRTGKRPVFMGQVEDNAYCRALRERFPGAVFQESRGAIADFQTFRNSAVLAPSVSTFSWLAAWLSRAEQVFLPVSGFLNPAQCPDIDLIPADDPRFRLFLFPINFAVPPPEVAAAHRAMEGYWRQMPAAMLHHIRARRPTVPREFGQFAAVFDEATYLQENQDVAAAVARGDLADGLAHYRHHGFREGRPAFRLDWAWYARTYPLAAFEVAQGDYADLNHHYAVAGSLRGYKAMPEA